MGQQQIYDDLYVKSPVAWVAEDEDGINSECWQGQGSQGRGCFSVSNWNWAGVLFVVGFEDVGKGPYGWKRSVDISGCYHIGKAVSVFVTFEEKISGKRE